MASGNVKNPTPLQAVSPEVDLMDESDERVMETSHIVVDDVSSDETAAEPLRKGVSGSITKL